MMHQYKQIKKKYKDAILFFRLGDFYEMFEDDAREASSLLDLTLTKRNGVPMCGIPYHAAPQYVSRLIKAGKKIAVCEQTSLPKPGKGIVTREISEVITPGTLVDENLLERSSNNYLVSLVRVKDAVAVASLDLSTGEFRATQFPYERREECLKREFYRLDPREIIVEESFLESDVTLQTLLGEREALLVNRYPLWSFDVESNYERLVKHFGVVNLKGFGLDENAPEVPALGIILSYVQETAGGTLRPIRNCTIYSEKNYLLLDEATQKNLELVRNLQDGSKKFTLLEVLNHTRTAMGARTLFFWLLHPLLEGVAIRDRQEAVAFFHVNQLILSKIRDGLGKTLDLQRLAARVAMERAHPKDLVSIKESLEACFGIMDLLETEKLPPSLAGKVGLDRQPLRDITDEVGRFLVDDPPILLSEGNIIRSGCDPELDRLRDIRDNARGVLDRYLEEEKRKTEIASLKLRFNRIIGYYFEVTKSNLNLVPDYFIRRQSLVGGERYTTNELGDRESEINNASERIIDLERELFLRIREQVKETSPLLAETAGFIAALDCFQSLAYAATVYGYTRPRIDTGGVIEIRDGRHPVVEAHLPGGAFVPNSIMLDPDRHPFIMLTGPNMAGKSTYLRQTALIVLMAQIGSFVPALDARISLVDKIFCRVGASDNLARGESTFLVEMNETAHILRQATTESLIIMDEVGRGTSTADGLAIARAVMLYILTRIGAKTVFATHFHELTLLPHERLANFSLEVVEKENRIVFLKRVKPGPADSSYGIHVAELAGLPEEVIAAARKFQRNPDLTTGTRPQTTAGGDEKRKKVSQPLLFSRAELIVETLKNLRIETTRPLDALSLLARWQEELRAEHDEE